jgi:DNA-directed RNA polymerase beta subunit
MRPARAAQIESEEDLNVDKINHSDWKSDRFLAEEVLIPWTNCTDASRLLMATSQVSQSVVLVNGEFPRIYTGYENAVGEHSSSYTRADRDRTVVAVIRRNDFSAAHVLVDSDDCVHVVYRRPCEALSDGFGFAYDNSGLDDAAEGDVITEGTVLRRSTAYDEDMNFAFGANLRAVYLPWHGLTYEDALVISESAAEKLEAWSVSSVLVSVNTNDLLLNLYGGKSAYKTFPDVGEVVTDRVICARRRIHHESMMRDLAALQLSAVNYGQDTAFYSDGTVVDVEVFSNATVEELEKHPHYNGQVIRYLKESIEYHTALKAALDPWVSGKRGTYTEEAAYAWRRSSDVIDPETSWRTGTSNNFDNYVVRFTLLHRSRITRGSKITNRYGGKGVVSEVLPDAQMPTTAEGLAAEIIVNPLGIINRLNPAQLLEQEVNMVADQMAENIRSTEPLASQEELLLDFLEAVSPAQAAAMREYIAGLDADGRKALIAECCEPGGIHVYQPPFFGNLNIDGLRALYEKYPWAGPYEFQGIESRLVMGDIYYLRLKHEPRDKFSARSSSYLNLKGVPSKSTRYKHSQQMFSKTPIRLGEMELFNLLAAGDMEEALRLVSQYSSNEKDREALIEALLTENAFDIADVPLTGTKSSVRSVLETYLKSMGMALVTSDATDEKGTDGE